jgi:hypothetical protein
VAGLEEYNKETGISRGSQTGCPFCAGKKKATLNVERNNGKKHSVFFQVQRLSFNVQRIRDCFE